MGNADTRLLKENAWLLRHHVVRMVGVGKTGHIHGSCSSAELMAVLYFHSRRAPHPIRHGVLGNRKTRRFSVIASLSWQACSESPALANISFSPNRCHT